MPGANRRIGCSGVIFGSVGGVGGNICFLVRARLLTLRGCAWPQRPVCTSHLLLSCLTHQLDPSTSIKTLTGYTSIASSNRIHFSL